MFRLADDDPLHEIFQTREAGIKFRDVFLAGVVIAFRQIGGIALLGHCGLFSLSSSQRDTGDRISPSDQETARIPSAHRRSSALELFASCTPAAWDLEPLFFPVLLARANHATTVQGLTAPFDPT